jgi:hypothetical protein
MDQFQLESERATHAKETKPKKTIEVRKEHEEFKWYHDIPEGTRKKGLHNRLGTPNIQQGS